MSKSFKIIAIIIVIIIAGFAVNQFFVLRKAHSTFDNYYTFRGCKELVERKDNYGICKLANSQSIKIVEINNKWYLDGDGPGVW